MITLEWDFSKEDEPQVDPGLVLGKLNFENDEMLLNFVMNNMSEMIDPSVYSAIDDGLTVYSKLSKASIEQLEDDTGMDPWDGISLINWMSQGGLDITARQDDA